MKDYPDLLLTRRNYLVIKAIESGAGLFVAIEAVASTLLENGLDPEVRRTWQEWERG